MSSKKDDAELSVLEAGLLPQYASSHAFLLRLCEAFHLPEGYLKRSRTNEGFVFRGESELYYDALTYFTDEPNFSNIREEFQLDLIEAIGLANANWFCDTIRREWLGGSEVSAPDIDGLKASIRDYLAVETAGRPQEFTCTPTPYIGESPRLDCLQISRILDVNRQMMEKHIHSWLSVHPNSTIMGSGDVYFRRGLGLDSHWDDDALYFDKNLINSYSLAFTPAEAFAFDVLRARPHAVLINAEYRLLERRILFFSPFIPGMYPHEFELGVIPGPPMPLKVHGRIHNLQEYTLNPT